MIFGWLGLRCGHGDEVLCLEHTELVALVYKLGMNIKNTDRVRAIKGMILDSDGQVL